MPNFFHINLKYTLCKCLLRTGLGALMLVFALRHFSAVIHGKSLSLMGKFWCLQMCPRTSASRPSRLPLCFCLMRTGRCYRLSFISWAMSLQLWKKTRWLPPTWLCAWPLPSSISTLWRERTLLRGTCQETEVASFPTSVTPVFWPVSTWIEHNWVWLPSFWASDVASAKPCCRKRFGVLLNYGKCWAQDSPVTLSYISASK